ncbi:hypothetical protein GCM10023185_00800 [Hymenobacter saemangeumensis]|uniref:OmpA-like domain-containing protein n=1 Tax=Hymenobacter saemangeumensis TaxID=1084522 RepID=A0ABP8HWU9_9BACT
MNRLLLFLLLLPGYSWAQYSTFVPDERTYYGLIDRGSGRCLDVTGASTTAGAATVQWEFTHAPSQQWRFVPVRTGSEYYRIESRHSKLCLTVDKPGENMPLVQRAFQGSESQQWKLVPAGPAGSFQLENKADGRCAGLAATDKFNGTAVVAQKPAGRSVQQWRLFGLRLNVAPGPSGFGPPAPLSGAVNSPGHELAPVLAPDGKTLYFTRTKFAGNTEGNTDTGDCWMSTSADGGQTWAAPQRLDAVNTPQDNGVVGLVGDKAQTLLVRGSYERDGSFRDEGLSRVVRAAAVPGSTPKAAQPQALRIANYYTATPGAGFFMSADEKVLILSLERGDSQGAKDLYYSRPDGAGGWTEPASMGGVLNSPGWDFAPWLAPDGKTLYFASYGHMGYGSADIFMSQRLDEGWTKWSEPLNLGPGINGPGFNAYFSLLPDGKTAFFSSAPTATGTADLWRAAYAPVPDSAKADQPLAVTEARAFLSGRVLDARTKQPVVGAEVKAILLPNAQGVQFNATGRADNSGFYQLSLLAGRYRLSASGGGLLTTSDTLLITGSPRRDLLLLPAAVGEKVDLPSIIFAQGKAGLLPSSYVELNRLAMALQTAPNIEVRLEGHTDNVGPADKNQQLSEDRVAEVKRYLVSRGVDEKRITTVGFGGSRPRYSNEREETRKLNRRVELVIVK